MNETVYLFALSSPQLLEQFVAVGHMQALLPAAVTRAVPPPSAAGAAVWSEAAAARDAHLKARHARVVRAEWVRPEAHGTSVGRRARRTA